jgi:hypothetical protein
MLKSAFAQVDTGVVAITSIAKESKNEHESQNALHPCAGPVGKSGCHGGGNI